MMNPLSYIRRRKKRQRERHEYFENLVRVRSKEELARRNDGLEELKSVLDGFDFAWFLTGGSLLGAVREKDFIKWDWDVEVTVLTEEVMDKEGELVRSLLYNHFEIEKIDRTYENFKIVMEKHENKYELLGRVLSNGMRTRNVVSVPAKFFETSQEVRLRDGVYPAPNPSEEYLTYLYGDWRTPKRSSDKEEYFSNEAFTKSSGERTSLKRLAKRALGLS